MLIVSSLPVSASTYLYNVDIDRQVNFAPGFSGPIDFVRGTITTDCNNCIVGAHDIVDWNLTVSVHAHTPQALTGALSGANSTLSFTDIGDLVATPLGLFFDFATPYNFLQLGFGTAGVNLVNVASVGFSTNMISWSVTDATGTAGDIINPVTSDLIGIPAGVPEPSTWAMLLIGFAGLGFLAHRRRRETKLA
jgi:hypothetical protein